jgi:hypothetical protein
VVFVAGGLGDVQLENRAADRSLHRASRSGAAPDAPAASALASTSATLCPASASQAAIAVPTTPPPTTTTSTLLVATGVRSPAAIRRH